MINIFLYLFTLTLLTPTNLQKCFEACNYFLVQSPGQRLVYGPLSFERADDKKQPSLKEQTTVRTHAQWSTGKKHRVPRQQTIRMSRCRRLCESAYSFSRWNCRFYILIAMSYHFNRLSEIINSRYAAKLSVYNLTCGDSFA
uniref:Putative secreted protein n=1 Tax=Ixodes scapularis TaxID=6945 RepID=A0A4D5REA0_IXOSC